MSWAPEVFVQGKWSRNQVRFATRQEAEASARNLMDRWMQVDDSRATEATEPVNYRWDASLPYPASLIAVEPIQAVEPTEGAHV